MKKLKKAKVAAKILKLHANEPDNFNEMLLSGNEIIIYINSPGEINHCVIHNGETYEFNSAEELVQFLLRRTE